MTIVRTRPQFGSPDEFIDHVAAALQAGTIPWEPATVQELQAAIEHFPDRATQFIPAQSIVWQTPNLRCLIDPWKRRLLDAVESDTEFRAQLRKYTKGGEDV